MDHTVLDHTLINKYHEIVQVLEAERLEFEQVYGSRWRELTDDSDAYLDARRNHLAFQIGYHGLNIHLICQMIAEGNYAYAAYIKSSFDALSDYVRTYKRVEKVNQAVIKDACSYLFLLCAEDQDILHSYLPYHLSLPDTDSFSFPTVFYYYAFAMAECLKAYGDTEAAVLVIRHLCLDHLQYFDMEFYQDHVKHAVHASLCLIADDDKELAYAICRIFEEAFYGETSAMSGDFYWFWSNVAFSRDEISEGYEYLQKCIDIRAEVFGDDNFFTIAAICERVMHEMEVLVEDEDTEFLCQVVEAIEEQVFDGIDYDYARYVEGRILFYILRYDAALSSKEDTLHYVDLFEEICNLPNKFNCIMFSPRVAKNMRGMILSRYGQYLTAEKYFKEALAYDSVNDPSVHFLSDEQIKINLLQLYYMQNDDQFYPLLDEMIELMESEDVSGMDQNDYYRLGLLILSAYELVPGSLLRAEDKELILGILQDAYEEFVDIQDYLDLNDRNHVMVILNGTFLLLDKKIKEAAELTKYMEALAIIKDHCDLLQLERSQIAILYYVRMFLYGHANDSQLDACIEEALDYLQDNEVNLTIRNAIYLYAACHYAEKGNEALAESCIDHACKILTTTWQESVKCLNDTRLINILLRASIQYRVVYALQRSMLSTYDCYEAVLNYKALASLAGRERNRILHSNVIDPVLIKRIHELQNHIATLEAKSTEFADQTILDDAREELRLLESDFSEKFPAIDHFTEISLNRVMDQLSDHTVVIEYFTAYTSNEERKKNLLLLEERQISKQIDVYVLKKINGSCSLYKSVIHEGDIVFEYAERMLDIFQKITSNSVSAEELSLLEAVNRELYDTLIGPIKKYLTDIKAVSIAPCNVLSNLPFGLLKGEDGIRLQDQYVLSKIECARDFLFHIDDPDDPESSAYSDALETSHRTLIMGDPMYHVREDIMDKTMDQSSDNDDSLYTGKPDDSSRTFRSIHWDHTSISSLPFSGMEALRISTLLSSDCYTGLEASKKRLLHSKDYQCIHLATHGLVDYGNDSDTLYSSCLLFAGAQNWLLEGKQHPLIGNGIVTADEISRQDWGGVELVVLSSCMSGRNDFSINKEFNGMVSALSAAGVHYVICSLWNQSDLATAVMMEEFYRLYKKGYAPYEALKDAQNYLKNVTILDLKQKGWLSIQDSRIQGIIHQYAQLNDRRKPFRNEVFWGGFECIRCN